MREAFISGGAGDIGGAIALELASKGLCLTVFDTVEESAASPALDRLEAAGAPDVTYVQGDVRDRKAVDKALDGIQSLDIAIGCAAIGGSHPFLELEPDTWNDTLAINLTGSFHVGQSAAVHMIEQNSAGSIIFIGSWVQRIPWPDITAYSVSKAGLEMLARQMARELARFGIRVNVVAPGIVDAGLARRQREQDPKYAARIEKVIPLGELQTPVQVAKAVSFLCSPDANYMTGSTLLADGGCSLYQFDNA